MKESFVLRVPPSVTNRLNRALNEDPISTSDTSTDIIMLGEPNASVPEGREYKDCLTPPMREAGRRQFRREPDLNSTASNVTLAGDTCSNPRRYELNLDEGSKVHTPCRRGVEIVDQDDDADTEDTQPAADAGPPSKPAPASVISPIP